MEMEPYAGPRPIAPGERLPGREQEIKAAANLLVSHRLVLLYGPSGAGRTSLIFAGVLPYLEKQDFPILCFRTRLNRRRSRRPGTEPVPYNRYLFSALSSIEEDQRIQKDKQLTEDQLLELCRSPLGLQDYLGALSGRLNGPGMPQRLRLLLIFDQFEELFSLDPTDGETKKEFFIQLLPVLQDEKYLALFSMREEYLGQLDPYLIYLPDRLSSRLRVAQLNHENALEAIREPARQQGVEFEAEAAQKLIDTLSLVNVETEEGSTLKPGPTVEPVLLQVVSRDLWNKLPAGKKRITVKDIQGLTGAGELDPVDQALGDYYDRSVQQISAETGVEEGVLRSWIQQNLIYANRIRSQYMYGSETTELPVRLILDELMKTWLVRADIRRGLVFYELAHDRLVGPILQSNQRWLAANPIIST